MRLVGLLALFLLVSGSAFAEPGPVFVADLRGKGVEKDLASTLSDLLASELAGKTNLHVTSQSQVNAVLHNQAASQAAGNEVDAADIARRMQAEYLVSGSVGRVGSVFVVTLDLSGLQAAAEHALSGKKNHWSLVAEGEVENLIAAVDHSADAVAEVLSPDYHPTSTAKSAPATPASVQPVANSDGINAAPAKAAGGGPGGPPPFFPPPPAFPPPWLPQLPPLPHPPEIKLPSPMMILSALTPDLSKLPEWKGLAAKEMVKADLDALTASLKKKLQN